MSTPEIAPVIDERAESRAANASLRNMTGRIQRVEVAPETIPEVIEEAAPVVIPEPVIEVAPVMNEYTYSYQIKDEDGTPMGAPQVGKYKFTQELPAEVFSAAIEMHRQATLALRREKRKQRFEVADETLTDADKFGANELVEFKPRELTADETLEISRDLLDPVKAPAARKKMTEAELGAPAASVGETLNRVQESNIRLQAQLAAAEFTANTPAYYKCQENFKKITDYMLVNNLRPTSTNFRKTYDILLADGFLQAGPTVREEVPVVKVEPTLPNTQATQEVPADGIISEEPAAEPRSVVHIPTGLNRSTTSDDLTSAPAQQRKYTDKEIDRMSSEEYRRLVVEPEYRARRAASRVQQ